MDMYKKLPILKAARYAQKITHYESGYKDDLYKNYLFWEHLKGWSLEKITYIEGD